MLNKYFFFYSSRCEISRKCLNLILNSNLIIKKLCIDNSNPQSLLGAGITYVPCLYDRITGEKIFGSSVLRVLTLLAKQFESKSFNDNHVINEFRLKEPITKSVLTRKILNRPKPNNTKTKSILSKKINTSMKSSTKSILNKKSVNKVDTKPEMPPQNNLNNNENREIINKNASIKNYKVQNNIIDTNYESMYGFADTGLEFSSLNDEKKENDVDDEYLFGSKIITEKDYSKNDNVSSKSNSDFDKRMQQMMDERNKINVK